MLVGVIVSSFMADGVAAFVQRAISDANAGMAAGPYGFFRDDSMA